MDLNREPQEIAYTAAEEIRALNHRTMPGQNAFPYPPDVSKTVLALVSMTERIPQTLAQLRSGLRGLEEREGIVMDDGSTVADEVATALRALLRAEQAFTAARGALQEASTPLFHMGGVLADEDEPAGV